MAEDTELQPQAEAEVQAEVQDGDTQPEPTPEPEQPGAAEPQPQDEKPAERVYSQKEWSERESAKDKEASDLREQVSQLAMKAQIAEATKLESEARTKDQKDIDDGKITEDEARQRQQYRQADAQMQPKREQMGRLMAAQDFGDKYNINPFELLKDKSLKTPDEMEAKAKQMSQGALEAERKKVSDELEDLKAEIKAIKEGSPKFDQGQSGTTGSALPDTAKGKIKAGWEELSKKK